MGKNSVHGCLMGAAAGDALGRSVRKLTLAQMQEFFGPAGITGYYTDAATGKALLSGDLQLTLFTANGLLYAKETGLENRVQAVQTAYMDWYTTQNRSFDGGSAMQRHSMLGGVCWLLDVPELYHQRAHSSEGVVGQAAEEKEGYAHPHTCSACASVVRAVPTALLPENRSLEETAREAGTIAALTLPGIASKMCSSFLGALIRLLTEGSGLEQAIGEARDICGKIYTIHPQWSDIDGRIQAALGLAPCSGPDSSYLPLLGEGWVPEEALAVSLFCALRHREDFTGGILAAVNRTGDSCTTGAETGAILGALLGIEGIPEHWQQNLELCGVIRTLSEDLAGKSGNPEDRRRRYLQAKQS